MTLSCTCGDWDGEPGTWAYYPPKDFSILKTTRRKRCKSCNGLIDLGATCLEFPRIRAPYEGVEEKIYGECGEIPIASYFMCEACGEIWLNLSDLGYCMQPRDDMREALKDYQKETGWEPGKGPGPKEAPNDHN